MSVLAPADRTRLAQLLGLLGSNFAGERDAAGLAAHRLITDRGLTWSDVVAPALLEPQPRAKADGGPGHGDWRRGVAACLRYPVYLNRWEREFLTGLGRFPG